MLVGEMVAGTNRKRAPYRNVLSLAAIFLISVSSAAPNTASKTSGQEARRNAEQNVRVPRVASEWWTIARNPDLGALTGDEQVAANFDVWQAADGTWQLWAHLVDTKAPGETRLFYRWQGESLTSTDWTPLGIALEADPGFGETQGGLQAPGVLQRANDYLMVYGDWNHICLARSWDGKTFARQLNRDANAALFIEPDGGRARDPMLLAVGSTFYLYYASEVDGVAAVYARTSTDLREWTARKKVSAGGRAGSGGGSVAGPYVYSPRRNGPNPNGFYLFRTHAPLGPSEFETSVYYSRDPLDFGVDHDDKLVTTLTTEVVRIIESDGEEYVVSLLSGMQGYQVARLEWAERRSDDRLDGHEDE